MEKFGSHGNVNKPINAIKAIIPIKSVTTVYAYIYILKLSI